MRPLDPAALLSALFRLLRRHPVGDADYPTLQEISDNAASAKELSEISCSVG